MARRQTEQPTLMCPYSVLKVTAGLKISSPAQSSKAVRVRIKVALGLTPPPIGQAAQLKHPEGER